MNNGDMPRNLPHDIWAHMGSKVGSRSIKDLMELKSTSKELYRACDDIVVYKNVTITNSYWDCTWIHNTHAHNFLDRCVESGNLYALYRSGLEKNFGFRDINYDAGMELLR
ncbi:hypothetical protein PIB30_093176 [Stylosanthes scabra]|uniref:At2g35280-like TPR domain-containing protein n=1 Tax=Stylosanthes scabra TaxID=79078 RepID=A0ABU6SVZ4_9FABA|nr:hypothetical protein [Stylosanthes scabra]